MLPFHFKIQLTTPFQLLVKLYLAAVLPIEQ